MPNHDQLDITAFNSNSTHSELVVEEMAASEMDAINKEYMENT